MVNHTKIWIDSLIAALPIGLAFEWAYLQEKWFGRKPQQLEHFLVIFIGTALTIYIFALLFKIQV